MILRVPLYCLYGLVALAFTSIKTPRSDKAIVDFLLNNCSKVLMQQKTNKQTNKQKTTTTTIKQWVSTPS